MDFAVELSKQSICPFFHILYRIKESPLPDQDIAKLIRISESQLLKADHTINFDRLAASFQMADRDHRETLSAAQVKKKISLIFSN